MKALNTALLFFTALSLLACGKIEESNPEPEETLFSVVGVWKDGNNHIVSFSEDGFYCAYLGASFIDDGSYKLKENETITSYNYYYNRNTEYKITSISEKSLTVSIVSKDTFGKAFNKTFTFDKTDIEPTIEKHALTAKSWRTYTTAGNVTTTFTTNDTGTKTSDKYPYSICPLKFFYVFINGYAYMQMDFLGEVSQIGGWHEAASAKRIQAIKISFASDGSISFIGDSSVLEK